MKYDTATPYIASYIIVRQDNLVAFVLRSNTNWMDNYYGLPSGKVEKNEAFVAAAIREAKEEIGIVIKSGDLRHVLTMHRKKPKDNDNEWVDMFFEVGSYEGEPYNAEPHIHSELAWLDIHNLPENVIPNVKEALKQIEAGNTYCEFGWATS